MRILWFTNTPSNASKEFNYGVFGGGWISALETLIVKEQIHEIGICFFYSGTEYKTITKDGVTYYGLPFEKEGTIERIYNRHAGKLNDTKSIYIDSVLSDFNPDLVHVFGTEMGYGELLMNKFHKVLFHLQGLTAPYAEVYFPNGIGKSDVLKKSRFANIIRGISFYNHYKLFKSRAIREVRIVKKWKYFTGRTEWDRNYIQLLNPAAVYFHNEELLREQFFKSEWSPPSIPDNKKNIVVGTTINPNIYKGLDLVYKSLALLSDYSITWKIFGLNEDNDLNKMVKALLPAGYLNSSIIFYGQIDSPALIAELKTCHFFVHPSYIDNSPNSVCEAMLLGMPVLSSSVGGIKSLITHQQNGFLFNPYDKYDLAGLLVSLINNYHIGVKAGSNARITAMKRHSPVEILKVLNTIYSTIYND